jgi:hypothetical protein
MSFLNDIDKHFWKAKINVREYRMGQSRRTKRKKKPQHSMCWTPLMQTSTNNANKTYTLLQTTRDRDEPNIVFM